MRPACLNLLLLLLFTTKANAQLFILQAPQRPANVAEGTVVQDKGQSFSIYRNGKWESMKGVNPTACYDLLYYKPLVAGGAGKGLMYYPDNYYKVYSFSAGSQCASALDVQCIGKIMRLSKYGKMALLLDARPNIAEEARFLTAALPDGSPQWTPVTVQGVQAYCLPRYAPNFATYSPDVAFRDWGILGIEGDWLVPPQFDAPFHFENGMAEVLYYGQKRRINEKGEFVE